MKYRFDINNVDIINLNGVDLRDVFAKTNEVSFEKTIGNLVFENSGDLDLMDKAREIHQARPIELSEREKGLFEEIIKDRYIKFVELQILAEIKEV